MGKYSLQGKTWKSLIYFVHQRASSWGNLIVVHQYPHREQETGKRILLSSGLV